MIHCNEMLAEMNRDLIVFFRLLIKFKQVIPETPVMSRGSPQTLPLILQSFVTLHEKYLEHEEFL